MQSNFIFFEKQNQRFEIYGSLKAIFDIESDFIDRAKGTIYNKIDFAKEDYEDKKCIIAKRNVIRSKHSKIL